MASLRDYDFTQEKTFQLVVLQRATVRPAGSTAPPEVITGPAANLISIAERFRATPIDAETFGHWNTQLVDEYYGWQGVFAPKTPEDEAYNRDVGSSLTVSVAFAQLGIWYTVLTSTGGIKYGVFVLPPYLSLYWDNLNNPEVLGEANAETVSITAARYNIKQWLDNLDTFISPTIQNETLADPLSGTIGAYVRDKLAKFWDALPDDVLKRAYVPVFGWSLLSGDGSTDVPQSERLRTCEQQLRAGQAPTNCFILENVAFFISKQIYQAYLEQRREALPAVELDPKEVVAQFQQIEKENISKLASTRGSFPDNPVKAIFVVPLEKSTPVLRVGSEQQTLQKERLTGAQAEKAQRFQRDQMCILTGTCKGKGDITEPVGFIDWSAEPSAMPALVSKKPASAALSRLAATKDEVQRVKEEVEAKLRQGLVPMSIVPEQPTAQCP